jgi:SpoVK/Ycf46/Vps4 family AAA+-type ATPase
MLLLQEHTKAICEKLTQVRGFRYKVFVLCGSPMSGKTTLAKEVCNALKGRYIDITTELLPYISKPVLGAYGPGHLVRWMESQLEEPEQVVCFDEIEALVATFGEQGAINLFEILKTAEPRSVAIVATQLESIVAKVAFPKDRIYFLSG